MSERKWTKGLWVVGNEDGSDERSIWASGQPVIRGGCSEFNGVRYGVLNLSDALLIAAAPDLYEALHELHEAIHGRGNIEVYQAAAKARAALQRAESES